MIRQGFMIIGFLTCLLNAVAFAADEETSVATVTWNDYKIIAERNIFSRYRTSAVAATRQQQVVTSSEQSYYTLRGITKQADGYISFIEDARTAGVTRMKKGDTLAGGKIAAITMDDITYEYDGNTLEIELGMNLEGRGLSAGMQNYSSGTNGTSQGRTGLPDMGQMPGMGQQPQGGMGQMPGMGQQAQGGMGQMPGMGQQPQGGMGQMPGMGQQAQMGDQSQGGRGAQGPGGMGQLQSSGQTATNNQFQQTGQQQGADRRQTMGQSQSTGQSATTGQSQSTGQASATVQNGQSTTQSVTTGAGQGESSDEILERLKERRKKELE